MLKARRITRIGLAAMLLIAPFAIIFAAGSSSDDLQGYNPVYSIGTGKDDWWIKYPDESPNAGSSVNHLSWIVDDLKQKPVIIFVHTSECKACKVQEQDLNKVLTSYGDDVKYYDMLADSPTEKVLDILTVYYPNAGVPTVPTTVMLTHIKDANGNVVIGWHSMDDAMGENVVASYVKDAIYYYRQTKS